MTLLLFHRVVLGLLLERICVERGLALQRAVDVGQVFLALHNILAAWPHTKVEKGIATVQRRALRCFAPNHAHLTGNVGFNTELFCLEIRILLVDRAAK